MEPASILIIDDEQAICDGCRMVLSENGYSVAYRRTGREGMEEIRKGDYDVVLLDLKLPDLQGTDILKTVRYENIDVHVIVMTGYATVKSAVQAMKLKAFDYLTKPFTDDELLGAVKRALENRRLQQENLALRKQISQKSVFSDIIGENPRILEIFHEIGKVAPTDSTVLLCGESGTGKELFARAIHAHSKRAARQFVAVDCSSFTSSLLESELFGHVKGAFTGAVKDKRGIFEWADHGTLFLDEVANLDMDMQAKMLRVMEAREFKPVGASHLKQSDVRIIAATNRDLKVMADEGIFRDDLFYRLNVFPIFIPPLRERRDDIPKLAYHFLRTYCRQIEKQIEGFSDDALSLLVKHDWPGNVRQLKNVVERLVIMAEGRVLDYHHLSDHWQSKSAPRQDIPRTLEELKKVKQQVMETQFGPVEKAFLQNALTEAEGNITQAAKSVGMQRSNFSTLMKKHQLSADEGGPS